MANKDDYLTYYREFFENFAQTVNPNDQLPVKLASYKLVNVEVVGGIIDWTTQYLTQKTCPPNLFAPLIKIVIEEIRKACKKQPLICGFNPADNAYEPLKLMQTVMAKTNEVCLRYLDNSMLCSLPSPGTPQFITSACAVKNTRRRMEDRHVVIHDLNTMFNIQEASPSSYYAIFDGHAGHDAAAYSSAHLHQFLAENKYFVSNPEQALLDAFCKTDALFIDKCKVENFSSGTTAVVALLRPKEKTLYIAWAGDSQALLVNQGRLLQVVNPHKPSRQDERDRIEKQGGCVMLWGTWRVNGQLAVSRAIGDPDYKPHVIAIPEIREIQLDGGEDFLILACDGLWDFLSEDSAARIVYQLVTENPDDTERISQHLVYSAKEQGSSDNISVIVVFLREPSKISAEAHWANRNLSSVTMEAGLDNANNPFAISNGAATDNNILSQKSDGLLLNLTDNFKQNGTDASPTEEYYSKEKSNGKRTASEFDDDVVDFRPETDLDIVDDLSSPVETAKGFGDVFSNNNPNEGVYNPFMEHQEKAALEMERSLQKQDSGEFEDQRLAREETPTPPADAVHDAGGLEESNVAESDSEDEWNYFKGDEANKENISPHPEKEVAEIPEEEDVDDDNMSQLNPNAAEFVPVSPTRSIPSPACRALINDQVFAQSPKRPDIEIDINVPNPREFEKEVKSRPSEVDSYSNGHESDGDLNITPTDAMDSLLNGKNIDEIPEFQPGSTPNKVLPGEEFHFGPNAAPFTPAKLLDQSEAALSTKAVYGDESAATLGLSLNESIASQDTVSDINILNKESDPMSMSFYADKGESNPFDLDKVQVLPDNLDEFLKQPDNNTPFDDTISDLPEHDPLGKSERPTVINLNNDDAIQTTDLDKQFYDNEKELASPLDKQFYDDEKELASPLEPEKDISDEEDEGIEELDRSKTPEPTNENLLGEYFCRMPGKKNVDIELPVDVELISPEPREGESPDDVDLISPDPREGESPDDVELISPEPRKGELPDGVELISPEPRKGELPDDVELISPEPRKGELPDDVELISPEPRAESSQEGDSEVKSPVLVATEAADLLEIGPESLPPDVELVTPELSSPELKETEDEIARITRHESVEVSDMLGGQTASEAADLVGKESESKSVVPDIQDLICARSGSISPECELPELEAKSSLRELDAVCELPAQSPVCELSMSKSPGTEQEEHTAQEQLPEQEEPTLPICEMPASKSIEDICELPVSKSTETKTEGDKVVVCEWPDLKLTERQLEDVSELPVSSENTLMESEVCASEISKSPEAEPKDVSELPVAHTQVAGLEEFVTPVCRLPLLKSPEPEHEEIPLVCNFPESKSSVCDLPESKSPIPEPEVCNLPLSPSTLRQDSCDFTKEELIKEAEERFEQIWKPSDSLQEDVISSSKDDASSFTPDHLIEDSFVADQSTLVSGVVHDMSAIQETTKTVDEESLNEQISEPEPSLITCLAADIENIVQDTVKVANQDQEILESCQTSSPKSVADTESVATTDVNSFLDRSLPPEVASPLSPTELQHMDERCDYEQENEPHPPPLELYNHHLGVCVYPLPPAHTQGEQFDLKTENILPEFAEQTTVTPSEDAPSAPPPEVENNTVEPANSGVTEVAIAGAVAAAAAIAAVATAPAVNTVGEKKKPTSASAKKLTASKSATTTKAPIPKPSPIAKTTNRLSTSPKTAPPKTGTAKPSPAAPKAAAAPKPLVKPRTVPIQKSAEKKPLANGDMKTTVRSTLTATKKISSETSIGRTPTTTSRPATATAKLSPTKTAAPKPTAAPRPATARHTTTRLTPTSNTATAKPRPTSLTTKTTTPGTSPAKTLSSTNKTTLTKVSPRTADAPLKSKPPTATAAPKARVPLTKTVSKAPDTEKQNKESANKITASRSTTNTTTATRTTGSATARTTSSTARRVEGKMTGTRTISKTTTTTMKSTTGKKPVEIVRNASSKTKTTKVEKPKENGVSTVVTEEITVVNNTSSIVDSEPQLIKDNSPMDNKLIMETTTLIQTSTAD